MAVVMLLPLCVSFLARRGAQVLATRNTIVAKNTALPKS